jgi:hypothetical protein
MVTWDPSAAISTPLKIGRVVLWGKSFTANDTASLKTSLLTSNFTQHLTFEMDNRCTRLWHKAKGAFGFRRYWVREEIKKGNTHNSCGFVDNFGKLATNH